jgi:pSer/pThr/pTyr-binding forkhead associated (FHA) protein
VGAGREPVPLDVPCLVGRNPSAPRVIQGRSPRLVRVASASKEVSATHLEVLQLGATVVVTDLNSTNGSVVRVPGRAPRMLRQGESVAVTPGTVVDIGDGNLLEILPLPHPGLVRREGDSDGARR